jgi:hypothetical protein
MKTTFLVARNLAVSPFEVMSQDLEFVIMVVNFLLDCANESKTDEATDALSEKEKDRDFWSAL